MSSSKPSYPLPAYLKFCPGGITYQGAAATDYHILNESKDRLIAQAKQADDRLRQYALLVDPNTPHTLPSLSVLAEHVFGRLTGCPAVHVKDWADALVLQYRQEPAAVTSEDEIWSQKPVATSPTTETAAAWLKSIHTDVVAGPCGYVFKRGDIAWNCRTCQTDATCVICDQCFRNSDHTGHEVYFHRTTPGGCCDCGDLEAWAVAGCCPAHRPTAAPPADTQNDPLEAVRMAEKGLQEGMELARTKLPPRVAAALGVVIGAAVQAIVQAVDGAGIASDPVQWKRRWVEEASHVGNGTANLEDYYGADSPVSPSAYWNGAAFPDSYQVQLRLHNDDVHTFDEVIEALHGDPRLRHHRHLDPEAGQSLVPLRENATEMTHHVDSDGQVTVRSYNNITNAMTGYQRLKSAGLHCAVVSVAQVQLELRARALISWLSDLSSAHPAAAALVVHAWVQVEAEHGLGGVQVWPQARLIPPWVALGEADEMSACRRRFQAFPPHLLSSFVTREESRVLHELAMEIDPGTFCELTGTDPEFYAKVPVVLPSERYRKSPHAIWGCLPSTYVDKYPSTAKHPLLQRLVTPSADVSNIPNSLTEAVYVVDTDLRKQQNPKILTSSLFPHKLPGLNMISGVGTIRMQQSETPPSLPNPMHWRHLLAISSFRAPVSPILLALLLDPYPTKQLRGALHVLFLSFLTDSRFRSRFAGALGVAYRPLSTLFCAGVGTEADTPLHFSVQILTAGSLVRALTHKPSAELLVRSDRPGATTDEDNAATIGIFVPPIAHVIVRCVHTNLLGATQEVNMILKNTTSGNDDTSADEANSGGNDKLLPALTYVAGEHPLLTSLPAAPDDGFLDSRSTRHKRLPHLLRDLEYVIETPGTAMRLLLPQRYPVYQGPPLSLRGEDVLSFSSVFARMLRLAQGMDTQKRKISGGHVEYEHNRWLEAFGLSLVLAGARDALAESPNGAPVAEDGSHLEAVREATGNFITSLLREMKLWLYRESLLETGLPVPTPHGVDVAQVTSLQRSTLHVSSSQYTSDSTGFTEAGVNMVALSCATGVKMTEAQLTLIENALKVEASMRHGNSELQGSTTPLTGPLLGDWLRVPHSPLGGDSLSFHLPLHRALAKCVRSICAVVIPPSYRTANPSTWWKLPVLDDIQSSTTTMDSSSLPLHPLVPLIRSTLRSANCRVNWSAGPDCTPPEAQRRRSRSRAVSANIAIAKVIHSFADHPLRSLAAAQQIERHLWARNGTSVAGMAMNYSNTPLCRSFRDLDLLLVQLSAAGMSCGLGARRVFSLMLSRFSMDGYLCDPERRVSVAASPTAVGAMTWVKPPRLQDPDHAVILAESFFASICVLVTELPPPPPASAADDSSLRQSIRRELLHALVAEPRSHSEAMAAASSGISRREESDGNANNGSGASMFTEAFTSVLNDIGKQKTRSASRASSGPPAFELKPDFCEEYDPTYFHLKRIEHQHAMDVVSRLRKQKLGNDKVAMDSICLPLVCPPPKAHPRFVPCRLLLHLDSMDAAIRRSLLFALTNGSWLPPAEPVRSEGSGSDISDSGPGDIPVSMTVGGLPDVPMAAFSRRLLQSQGSASFAKREDQPTPFSKEVVAASSVSFLEVLQLLTLQIHTLEECASLHRILRDLDDESRLLSAGLSINSYLGRLTKVPTSLVGVWALRPHPEGPLQSKGSGENRGSILGLLIALYEHRSDHGAILDSEGGDQGDEGHGGARSLASSGLKWILRFVNALVDGAQSVGAATKSATSGIRIRRASSSSTAPTNSDASSSWTIDANVKTVVSAMLSDLPDLWPVARGKSVSPEKASTKSSEAGKAAQKRQMEIMKRMQAKFAATIKPSASSNKKEEDNGNKDLCIICRCDDVDGENNGPLGYLGHVQRSRVTQMRGATEAHSRRGVPLALSQSYRVVGHMGCQLRETDAMDSKALTCLPKGSVVRVVSSKVSTELGIRSRRVLVRHEAKGSKEVTEGWASVQSSQGYVILSPLLSLCYTNSRWGSTRPVIKQCGHAAHLKCVEMHTLSLHHRAASEQTYDGRFAANIDDGEFLCPLCKQLSNILIPRSNLAQSSSSNMDIDDNGNSRMRAAERPLRDALIASCAPHPGSDERSSMAGKALEQFGSKLYSAMCVPWERATGSQRKHSLQWDQAIQKWDYEDEEGAVKDTLRLLREQLIAWSAVGHSAAAQEASTRSVEEVLPFGIFAQTSDPWSNFDATAKDSHPMLLELKRLLTGSSGLLRLLCGDVVGQSKDLEQDKATFVGVCLADILEGKSWVQRTPPVDSAKLTEHTELWSGLATLISAMPCHVARDGTIPQRCEARATAAAMWTVHGLGRESSETNEVPSPYCVGQLPDSLRIGSGWGTLNPLVNVAMGSAVTAYRPAIASAFLHIPLLCWDLYTLSAAAFSALLSGDDIPTSKEVILLAKLLLTGRIVQAIVTPGGFDEPDEMELDEEDCWNPDEIQIQGLALAKLASHCREAVKTKTLGVVDSPLGDSEGLGKATVLAGVGRAILPFSRALLLMIRACTAAIREREKTSPSCKESEDRKLLDALICSRNLMTLEDGFHFVKAMKGPSPSTLCDASGEWWQLINRWLTSAAAMEQQHSSSGRVMMQSSLPTKSLSAPPPSNGSSRSAGNQVVDMETNVNEGDGTEHIIVEMIGGGAMPRPGIDDDEEEEYDDMMQDVDMADVEELSQDQLAGVPSFGLPPSGNGDGGESSEDYSSSDAEEDGDREYAHAGRSPILYYQPGLLGLHLVGPGTNGAPFDYATASDVMSDLSHLGLVHQRSTPIFGLIRLPKSFVELYNMVSKVKGRHEESALDENDDIGNSETAICLLTGAVMRSGSARRPFSRAARQPGACTMHARKIGSGIGIFFLVQKCTVLLMHNNKSAYSPSLYVDMHGEEDPGLKRGRPLFLNEDRYRALEQSWRQQGIPGEVAQIRSTSDRVIRDNWY